MQCAHHAISNGKSVIILVPEISLTPQMVRRFTSRFGNNAAVLHSRLSAGERYDEWQRLRSGQANVAIGARSAIFAPVTNIGLIVVDEEHESSYRSQNRPRYDALEIAKHRVKQNNAALVFGSATPQVTSYYAARHGEMELIELPNRIGEAQMPKVKIVDMREEFAKGNKKVVSQDLFDALDNCINNNEQAILFLNRRGFRNKGYNYLSKDSVQLAIDVFKINVALHPTESNPYDNLGEAYLKLKDTVNALKNYTKALEFDSGNGRIKRRIEKLEGKAVENTN